MEKFSRDEIKKRDLKSIMHGRKMAFKYSFDGLEYAYTKEQSMIVHLLITALVIFLGVFFKISRIEWIFCVIFLTFIMITELLNSAIEAAVDFTSTEIHPLAKVAKDCGSAATFVGIFGSVLSAILIFVPKIMDKWF